jgi:hypothetical protein
VRQWADVYIPALDVRLQLEKKALFYVPSALERCAARSLTVAHLGSISRTAPIAGLRAGRNAIGKIFRFHPVTYDRAVGFINVANVALKGTGEEFTTRDIVACAFRLRQPMDVLQALNISVEEMAREAGISNDIGHAAVQRYRIQLHDALAIWHFILSRWRENPPNSALVSGVITEDPRDFVRADLRAGLPIAVRRLDDFEYVYRLDDLKPAPISGHYWAIEEVESDGLA